MNKIRNLNRLGHFVAIVEEGTITAAAKRLNLSKAVVSKQLQLLEEEIGVNLLVRNTRNLQISETGKTFYLHSKAALEQAFDAFAAIENASSEPVGKIRISATVDYGTSQLSSVVTKFSSDFPQIEIDLVLNDGLVDLVEDRFDLAIRVGWLKDSSNLARKLGNFREVAIVDSQTAVNWGATHPKDLENKRYITFSGVDDLKRTFTSETDSCTVRFQSNLKINITSAVLESVMLGECFGIVPEFIVKEALAAGRVVELLPHWKLRSGGIYVVCPPSRLRTRAVDLFLSRLVEELHDGNLLGGSS